MIIWNYVAQYIYTTLSLYIVWLGADVIFSYVDALAERHSRFNIFQREEAFFEPHWKAASNACTCRTRLCSLWWWGHHHFWRSLVFNREQQVICIGMFSRTCRTNTWMSVCTRLSHCFKSNSSGAGNIVKHAQDWVGLKSADPLPRSESRNVGVDFPSIVHRKIMKEDLKRSSCLSHATQHVPSRAVLEQLIASIWEMLKPVLRMGLLESRIPLSALVLFSKIWFEWNWEVERKKAAFHYEMLQKWLNLEEWARFTSGWPTWPSPTTFGAIFQVPRTFDDPIMVQIAKKKAKGSMSDHVPTYFHQLF